MSKSSDKKALVSSIARLAASLSLTVETKDLENADLEKLEEGLISQRTVVLVNRLGPDFDASGLTLDDLEKLVADKDAAEKAAADAAAAEQAGKDKDAEAAAAAAAEQAGKDKDAEAAAAAAKKKHPFVVAHGKSVTTKRGILEGGQPISPRDLSDDEDAAKKAFYDLGECGAVTRNA